VWVEVEESLVWVSDLLMEAGEIGRVRNLERVLMRETNRAAGRAQSQFRSIRASVGSFGNLSKSYGSIRSDLNVLPLSA